jgi:hypothetical protein
MALRQPVIWLPARLEHRVAIGWIVTNTLEHVPVFDDPAVRVDAGDVTAWAEPMSRTARASPSETGPSRRPSCGSRLQRGSGRRARLPSSSWRS